MPGLKFNSSYQTITWSDEGPFIRPFVCYKGVWVYALYMVEFVDFAQIYCASHLIPVKPSSHFVKFLKSKYSSWDEFMVDELVFMVHEDDAHIIEG